MRQKKGIIKLNNQALSQISIIYLGYRSLGLQETGTYFLMNLYLIDLY